MPMFLNDWSNDQLSSSNAKFNDPPQPGFKTGEEDTVAAIGIRKDDSYQPNHVSVEKLSLRMNK